jgi:hypothetical protein
VAQGTVAVRVRGAKQKQAVMPVQQLLDGVKGEIAARALELGVGISGGRTS